MVIDMGFPGLVELHIDKMSVLDQGNFLLLLLSIGIAAPFIEEIMFRGLIFNNLKKVVSLKNVVLIQAILFGVYHMSIVQGAYAAMVGVFLGVSLVWTGSIWAPVLIHAGNNIYSTTLTASSLGYFLQHNHQVNGAIFLFSVLILLPFGFGYLYKKRVAFDQSSNR
ncbi:CPBP family intramembrane glutamic endopeptidase [Proteinivorax hydrogeniformans]|uniref:CPBP family intramembrane glutamic endopeptidase n=1 Tax=Proteinivorax hydrogeniformans TaxID=1826727 RepID=A0AAU8HQK7_9FIRM